MERHETVRPLILRSLGKLACVTDGSSASSSTSIGCRGDEGGKAIGPRCLATLGELMQGGSGLLKEVKQVVDEIIVNAIKARSTNLQDPGFMVLVKGLAVLCSNASEIASGSDSIHVYIQMVHMNIIFVPIIHTVTYVSLGRCVYFQYALYMNI
jgi:hypothetical protein